MQLQLTARSVAAASSPRVSERVSKYLAFYLGREEYGVEVMTVREIIGVQDITAVPHTPRYMKGVINLRGKVIPVLDLRQKLEMPELPHSPSTCIIVIQSSIPNGSSLTGIIVDGVLEVFSVAAAEVQATPDFGAEARFGCVLGLAKVRDRLRILLDVAQITGGEQMRSEEGYNDGQRGT